MDSFVLKGNICHSISHDRIECVPGGYLVCENGVSRGIFTELPEKYSNLPLVDNGDCLIIPGMSDLHIHASQYAYRGMGMDLELLDWLYRYAFPEEAKFADAEYADKAYTIFADAMRNSATTRACIFASAHTDATLILMDKMEKTGLVSFVGRVNMDRDAPDSIREPDPATAAKNTEDWVLSSRRFEHTYPILTPRFIPSCTDKLLDALGEIRRKYEVSVQSHISENLGEIELVKKLRPDARYYGDAYLKHGLFGDLGSSKTVMAHCVWSGDEELAVMKENGVFICHCPASNMNVASGIAPVRRYIELSMKMGLGSDVAGGQTESMFRAVTDAVQSSKLYWRHVDTAYKPIGLEEAFYLATRGGGEFFGKVGAFDDGYEFDAVVLDDSSLPHPQPLDVRQRLERAVYLGVDRFGIRDKYVRGKRITLDK